MRLQTPRLTMREVTAADCDRLDGYMAEPAYWRTLPIDPPTPRSVKAFVEQCVLDRQREPRAAYFLVATQTTTGLIVGEGSLHVRSESSAEGELGWGVDPAHAAAGYATEIGEALLAFGFDRLDLHRLYARCRVDHGASRRIMAKLGMIDEGILREHMLVRGQWWSSAQTAVLAHEWRARRGVAP